MRESVQIVPALEAEASLLTELALRSNAHWGYPKEWLNSWQPLIEILPESIEKDHIFKAILEQNTVGFYRLFFEEGQCLLTGFGVLPDPMGRGMS